MLACEDRDNAIDRESLFSSVKATVARRSKVAHRCRFPTAISAVASPVQNFFVEQFTLGFQPVVHCGPVPDAFASEVLRIRARRDFFCRQGRKTGASRCLPPKRRLLINSHKGQEGKREAIRA